MTDQRSFDVVVVGSANVDRSIRVASLPRPGETVLGQDVIVSPGGKGANQAVAAARQGASVAFVGSVGDDRDGGWLRSCLEAEGIDTSHLSATPGATGQAVIVVDDQGENCIALSPGANARITDDHIREARPLIASAKVVLAQLEIPLSMVNLAFVMATGRRILNPAPAPTAWSGLSATIDLLVPNLGELAALSGDDATDRTRVAESARRLSVGDVVVTLGGDGSLLIREDDEVYVPAAQVAPVDTTGAGDTFCGVLAAALAQGRNLEAAVRGATVAAGVSVTSPGAQAGMPTATAGM